MRAIHVIALSGFGAAGLVFALVRSSAVSLPLAATPPTGTAVAPPPRNSEPLGGAVSPAAVTEALTCIQNALGGVSAFAAVTSLRTIATTKVTVISGPRPIAVKREISVQFPDRFKLAEVQTNPPRGSAGLTLVRGFNGNVPLSDLPPPPDEAVPTVGPGTRRLFVEEVLMRLPRELPNVRLSQRTIQDAGQERIAITASGLPGLDATLFAVPGTCMPVAIQYNRTSPFAGRVTQRVALSQFRRFNGILFPTVLRTTQNGEPWADEYVSEVLVNKPFDEGHFRAGGK